MKKIFKVYSANNQGNPVVSMRCPSCGQLGTWAPAGNDITVRTSENALISAGHRGCPNPECGAHVFVVHNGGKVSISYPAETIDFDASAIPPSITSAFEEAITCHANQCFVASAIMVRKTLEELCRNVGAKGGNLKERIKDLSSQVVLPKELLDGLDDIRLLGNDAAHVESQEYNQIGQQELDVAIEFTKEVLKAMFQYKSLRDKLRGLRKVP